VTLVTGRQPQLIRALERLADDRNRKRAGHAADEVVQELTHSEYLPTDIEPGRMVRVAQISAPVFQADGEVAATIMLLGPMQDLTAAEVSPLGEIVAAAAADASREVRGSSA
jgi:hypothetical protein